MHTVIVAVDLPLRGADAKTAGPWPVSFYTRWSASTYGVRVYAKEPITGLALDSTSVMVRIGNSGIATCSLFSCPSEKS